MPSRVNLDKLLSVLDVKVVAISECLVSQGYRLELGPIDAPGIHYTLSGHGKGRTSAGVEVELVPHTLVVVPPNDPFTIEASPIAPDEPLKAYYSHQTKLENGIRRHVAGDTAPEVVVICGFFKATYGASIPLFSTLGSPIIERFDSCDGLDTRLQGAMNELINEELGSGAMTAALLTQVIVMLLRRSLRSMDVWLERFAVLSDPAVARALSAMVASPGEPHTVNSLAGEACLSRSAFMSRFSAVVGKPPMVVLRDLRMRLAQQLVEANHQSIDSIAHTVGYASRSSFLRAFRETYDQNPTPGRALAKSDK